MNRCFRCNRELGPVFQDDEFPQFFDAVTFSSPGTYGSQVYDVALGARAQLILVICDQCLIANKEQVLEQRTIPVLPVVTYSSWEPDLPS